MENEPIKDENKKGLFSGWRWLLWWQISPEQLEGQVENYKTLKITKSARGLSFLFCMASSILTLIIALINRGAFPDKDMWTYGGFYEIITIFVLGFFIYKGQRWAIIGAMLFWTAGKSMLVYEVVTKNSSQSFPQIAWWCLYMHAFYVALKVENLRRRAIRKEPIVDDKKTL